MSKLFKYCSLNVTGKSFNTQAFSRIFLIRITLCQSEQTFNLYSLNLYGDLKNKQKKHTLKIRQFSFL